MVLYLYSERISCERETIMSGAGAPGILMKKVEEALWQIREDEQKEVNLKENNVEFGELECGTIYK